MSDNNREYSNEEITVFWKPDLCIHSEVCFRSLPRVFNPKRRPWVKVEAAETSKIIEVVDKCPAGALSYKNKNDIDENKPSDENQTKIKISKDGPAIITGNFKIINIDGSELNISGKSALCRCGASKKMPFCDGSHREINFKG